MTVLKRKLSMIIIIVSLALTIGMLFYGLSVFNELQDLRASETALLRHSRNLAQSSMQLQRALGFGGYIHNVKEYLLHRDPNQLLILQANIREIEESYAGLKKLFHNMPRSSPALKTLDRFIASIKDQYQILSAPENRHLAPADLDLLLAAEDPTTLSAIVTLESLASTYTKTAIGGFKSDIDKLSNRLVFSSVLLPLTLGIGCFLAWLLNHTLIAKKELESARQSLLEKDEWLEETGRTAKVGGWEVDIETAKAFWTKEVFRIYGLPLDQTPSWGRALSFYPPDGRKVLEQALEEAADRGKPFDLELPFVNSGGENLFVRTICKPIVKDGKVVTLRGSFQNITDRKLMEIRLRETQKMEVVGRMAGGIAHNFNNSLAVIMGNIELAQLKLQQVNDSDKYLDEAMTAAKETRDLVRKILTFSPQDLYKKAPIQLTQLADEIITMIEEAIPRSIDLKCDISMENENITVNADPILLKEAMISLYNNAVFAMDGKGALTLSLDIAELQKEDIPVRYRCSPGTYARISIKDTGCGMRRETLKNIFDPFFTTKDVGQGTGIGLTTVQGVVDKHGGLIKVKSAPEQGTKFELFLPVAVSA